MGNSSKCEKLPTLSISYFSNSKINDFQKKRCVSLWTQRDYECKGGIAGEKKRGASAQKRKTYLSIEIQVFHTFI